MLNNKPKILKYPWPTALTSVFFPGSLVKSGVIWLGSCWEGNFREEEWRGFSLGAEAGTLLTLSQTGKYTRNGPEEATSKARTHYFIQVLCWNHSGQIWQWSIKLPVLEGREGRREIQESEWGGPSLTFNPQWGASWMGSKFFLEVLRFLFQEYQGTEWRMWHRVPQDNKVFLSQVCTKRKIPFVVHFSLCAG